MIITLDKTPCIELSFADFDEHSTILSFELDKQLIKEALLEHDFNKVYNWNTVVDFDIEIDSVNTFDSVNLRRISYSTLQHYNGNRVYACIVPIAKRQEDEELTFYYRIHLKEQENLYEIRSQDVQGYYNFTFVSDWSEPCEIKIKQNYTLNILHAMYDFIADYNSYNKEVKSANFYSFLVPTAVEFSKVYDEIRKTKEMFIIERCDTNELNNVFGNNYGFNLPFNMHTEEYRRLLLALRRSYISAGTFDSIAKVLIYFFGEEVEYTDFKGLYPWILRNEEIEATDPSYLNWKSNYYLYSPDTKEVDKAKNEVMLLNDDFAKFNFEIKTDNFYNCQYDTKDIISIINKLKPVYTKCITSLGECEIFDPPPYVSPLLVSDDIVVKGSDDSYIRYK